MILTSEVTVTIKSEDRTFKEKFVIYDKIELTLDCPILKACVDTAKQSFKGNPDEIIVKVTAAYE